MSSLSCLKHEPPFPLPSDLPFFAHFGTLIGGALSGLTFWSLTWHSAVSPACLNSTGHSSPFDVCLLTGLGGNVAELP